MQVAASRRKQQKQVGGAGLRLWASFFAAVFVACFTLGHVGMAVDNGAAQAAVDGAEASLRHAFAQVLDAEVAGANVSGLVAELTHAGSLLTSSEGNLSLGDISVAYDEAVMCKSLADSVARDASVLRADAVAAQGRWWLPVTVSVVGSGAFLVVLFVVWRKFKGRYTEGLLRSRPEVVG